MDEVRRAWPRPFLYLAMLFQLACIVLAQVCEPAWFLAQDVQRRDLPIITSAWSASMDTSNTPTSSTTETAIPTPWPTNPLITKGNVTEGEVICRYTANTYDMDLNYYTCSKLAKNYGISVDLFFQLNPTVNKECNNLRPNTEYCVRGSIQVLVAWDRKCGPPNRGATCRGTRFPCCNANTFTCGDTVEDCAPGTCFEGICPGDKVWSTNDDCGKQHGYKQCAGKWGDCCNADGKCGTGQNFCGWGNCQLGNCSNLVPMPATQFSMRPFTPEPSTDSLSTSTSIPSTTTRPSTTTTATSAKPPSTSIAGFDSLPACGKTCFSNMLGQYSSLGCAASDSYCLCNNAHFKNGLRDCSNGACGTAVGSTVISVGNNYCATATATHTAGTATGFAALPSCGQTCFNNMQAQYAELGCAQPAPACLCKNVNFSYGLRDCANGACGTAAATPVIAYGSSYCASATGAH